MDIDELTTRLGEVVLLDVRSTAEYDGTGGYDCDPRRGHIPGARHLDLSLLLEAQSAEEVRELVGEPEGAEVVAYCHSGGRSGSAVAVLAAAGYKARNFTGSWHEWSRRDDLPIE